MTSADTKRGADVGDADVIVLGVGTCGEDLSLRLMAAGLSVIGIEAALVGGECAYWACLPSKMMIRAANALAESRRVAGLAGSVEVRPDWTPVATRVRNEATGGWDDSTAVKRFEGHGGRLIHGRGRISGPHRVSVNGETLTARIGVVIATGSRPVIPDIPGLAGSGYWTTHDVIAAERLPQSIIVLGGGAVGCELGQVMARFGTKVTIVEANDRILAGEEPEASQVLASALATEGVEVRAGAAAVKVEARNAAIEVTLANGEQLSAERVLVATGRKPDLRELGLDAAGMDGSNGVLAVDDSLRAGDGFWAMGDVTGKAMFTHVALYQSAIVAADILGEEHQPARYDAVPRAVFTDPEVGGVGMTEADARAAGLDVVVAVKQLPATFRGWLHVAGGGVIKLVADRTTGTLVGATAAGPNGAEMLGLLSLAVHNHVPLADLRSMIYAFPTFYGAIGEAVGAYGRGLARVIDPGYEGFRLLDEAGE